MRNNEHTRALLPCRGWSAQACMATQELPCPALPCLALLCLALPCFALPCPALPCLALLCSVPAALCLLCFARLCAALPCSALYPALLTLFRGPIPQRQGRQIQPAGRRAGMRDVFVRDMDVPYKNFCRTCAPVARSASGARTGCVSLVTFLCTSKESNSRPKGVKALLPVSSCIKESTRARGPRTKSTEKRTHFTTKQPANQPHTFNNKNSRSHELITRKNVSYSFRFTEI